ncbi:metallophosphoesterase [Candidatus Falkowbacteria bacterium]|nr:metallophosphoesterase [Candidatus Falkowbacteria bacterium]
MYIIIRSFFYPKKQTRKSELIRICFLVILLTCFVLVLYGSFIEPKIIRTKQINLDLKQTDKKENIKIALISDLHVGRYKKSFFINRVVKKIDNYEPDLILLGGDYILGKEKYAYYLQPLEKLSKKYPIFAVTGNHEFGLAYEGAPRHKDKTKTLRELFKKWNIEILDNKTAKISVDKNDFNLTGIPDIWTQKDNLHVAKYNLDPRTPNILLCHNPDIILDKESEIFDLILSGHTHGGQIRLPWLGSVPSLPTELGRPFDKGLFKIKQTVLYISSGLGETGTRARLFDPPEINIITLDL